MVILYTNAQTLHQHDDKTGQKKRSLHYRGSLPGSTKLRFVDFYYPNLGVGYPYEFRIELETLI